MDVDHAADIVERALGYRFVDRGLLALALTHRTWIEERHPGGSAPAHECQQRLEFLGDALLNYVVGRWLYEKLPTAPEGELTGRRKQFTKGEWLRERGEALGLRPLVRLGRGEATNVESNRKLLEDTIEAIIGAVALDGGDEPAARIVRAWLPEDLPAWEPADPLVQFNEWFQKRYRANPPQPVCASSGPAHRPTWTAELVVDGRRGFGSGSDADTAKRAACRDLLAQVERDGEG